MTDASDSYQLNSNRPYENCSDTVYFDTFTPFPSCHLPMSMLPWWLNPPTEKSCQSGKWKVAITSHTSGHLNVNKDCKKMARLMNFFGWFFSFYLCSIYKIYVLSLKFCLFSFCSYLKGRAHDTTNHFKDDFFAWGWDFFSGFRWILSRLFLVYCLTSCLFDCHVSS